MATAVLAVIRAHRPVFRNKFERVAFAVHAVAAVNGLKLLATGQEVDSKEVSDSAEESPVDGWNLSSDSYSFLYSLSVDGKTRRMLLRGLVVDELLMISVMDPAKDEEPQTIELDCDKYVAQSSGTDLASSYANLDELVTRVQSCITEVTETPGREAAAGSSAGAGQQTASSNLLSDPPNYSNRPPALEPKPKSPLLVGRDDVMPGGVPRPGFSGGDIPGGPFGGGMHVGPSDPFFAGRLQHPDARPGVQPGLPGQPGGMRWDPIAPEGLQGWRPDDYQRGAGGRGWLRREDHPDVMPRGPGRGTDWDSMFG